MLPTTPTSKRRSRLTLVLATAGLLIFAGCNQDPDTRPATADTPAMELGIQLWTLREMPLLAALDTARELGFRTVQLYPGQNLGGGLEGRLHHTMSAELRDTVRAWLEERNMTAASYGVVGGRDAEEWRRIFDFAVAFGMQAVASEPPTSDLPWIAELAAEAGIQVAVHNHPPPTRYADPETALAAVADLGPHVGICADTGHWMRGGHDPVEALRLAEGRIIELHFKDLDEFTRQARDVPWGTGVGDAAGMIAELRRQGFSGVVYLEYEYQSDRLLEEIAASAEFFRRALAADLDDLVAGRVPPRGFTFEAAELWAEPVSGEEARWPGAQPLLRPDLSNAEFRSGAWEWEDDVLVARGRGDLWTSESYGDFVLSLEFKTVERGNSGVFIRVSDTVDWLHHAIEIQILQGGAGNPKHVVGAIYDIAEPSRVLPVVPGQWHRFVIRAEGPRIRVQLDGEWIVDANLDHWTEAGRNPDGTPNKFRHAYRDMAREGRIGLQDHGSAIAFRNLFIEPL